MASVYNYQIQEVLPGGNGQPERRIELLSEDHEKSDTAIKQLNDTLTAMKDADGNFFTPRAIPTMEASLASEGMFSEMVFLPDMTIKFLSITRRVVQ